MRMPRPTAESTSTESNTPESENEQPSMASSGDESPTVPEASETSVTSNSTSKETSRYPPREHHAPDYYRPQV